MYEKEMKLRINQRKKKLRLLFPEIQIIVSLASMHIPDITLD